MVVSRQENLTTVEVYFNDLNDSAKEALLESVGVERPADMNWDMDICPIAIIDFENDP